MRIRFDRLWYKFRDYEKFKRFITVIAKFQRDYRIKYMKRRLRHQIQQGRLISDTFDMIKHRLDFKKLISVVIFVQKTWKWIRFLRLIRFAKYIKELIYEHYDNQVWPEIRGLIQVRSCLKIQKTVRGHIIRCKYSEERTHLRIFKINLYQNFSAKKIQKIFKGWQVRTKLQEMEKASIHIQAFVRGMRVRKVFKVVKKAAIVIQVCYYDFRTIGGCTGFQSTRSQMLLLERF